MKELLKQFGVKHIAPSLSIEVFVDIVFFVGDKTLFVVFCVAVLLCKNFKAV